MENMGEMTKNARRGLKEALRGVERGLGGLPLGSSGMRDGLNGWAGCSESPFSEEPGTDFGLASANG